MTIPQPQRPKVLPDYSEVCLNALVDRGLAHFISLGGALGLLHYLDYRSTHDVDAWWSENASTQVRHQVIEAIVSALQPYGEVNTRTWGDVVSVELSQAKRKIFSFQIARRSVQLEPADNAPWIDVPLDSFSDLVSSKMVALVERGAPRDFRDIHALCAAGLATSEACWALWRQRQSAAGSDTDLHRARLAITTHLTRIIQHRRLEQIADPVAQQQAALVRTWFLETFLSEVDDADPLD